MQDKPYIYELNREIEWLRQVIDQAIKTYLLQEGHENNWQDIPLPEFENADSPYAHTVRLHNLGIYERLALALAMAPHLQPEALDIFFGKNQLYDRGFSEFGGVTDKNHSGFLPTGQTLCFLATVNNPALRYEVVNLLSNNHALVKEQILVLSETDDYLPQLSGVLSIAKGWLQFFVTGQKPQIEQSSSFPAQRITSLLNWDDIVLDDLVMQQIDGIRTWLQHGNTLMNEWGLHKKIKPGYRALFYGPPGTGKTLTATLLGKVSERDVYRIDLSMMVSKYIGETEKNLSKVFETARHKNWILFFDEADALFGKRTAANSSNDRHANQQTAHLLQQIEDFPGVVILASNLRSNMDEAFTRRFQSIIHFAMPSAQERLQLWQNAFDGGCRLSQETDLQKIADNYELAGGSIINVLRFCAIRAIAAGREEVSHDDLLAGIRMEYKKDNKTIQLQN